VEVADGEEVLRREETLAGLGPEQRAAKLVDLDVRTLICGAISQPLEGLLTDSGVRVHACRCGEVEEILQAFCAGTLKNDQYAMPGCCGRRRQRVRGRRGGRS
jgi:predicted Fe-Mo cluster-binding NifX family protein